MCLYQMCLNDEYATRTCIVVYFLTNYLRNENSILHFVPNVLLIYYGVPNVIHVNFGYFLCAVCNQQYFLCRLPFQLSPFT